MAKTLIEPFRIKSIEPIRMITRQERAAEKVLFTVLCKKGALVPNKSHF